MLVTTEKFKLAGRSVNVKFIHFSFSDPYWEATICVIRDECSAWAGVALLHPKEEPNVEVGRRIAFKRATMAFAYDVLVQSTEGFTSLVMRGIKRAAQEIVSHARLMRWRAQHPDIAEALQRAEAARD